mgnify:CR=1 FL=1
MAENSKNSSRNEQFLQKLEHQRLNKPSNNVIDLRGKVAGECQAYTFGGKTHYLDDRAYLVTKQLLDKFKGRYTIGVYETVLKIVKTLNQQQPIEGTRSTSKQRSILINDPNQPQLISFDQLVRRQEDRIVYSTAIKITVSDMLYSAATIDITTSAIRISLKRSYTLEQGDEVLVSFTDFNEKGNTDLLSNIPYKITKIKHEQSYTQAILIRDNDDNVAVSNWLGNWIQRNNTLAHQDLDNKLLNLVSQYYLRQYSRSLNDVLLWLGQPTDEAPIKAFHCMPEGQSVLNLLLNDNAQLDFSLLPLNTIMTSNDDMLVAISRIQEKTKSIAVPRMQTASVAKALNWAQQHDATVLLLSNHEQSINPTDFTTQIEHIADRDLEVATQLTERLSAIQSRLIISDITSSCQNTESVSVFTDTELEDVTMTAQATITVPNPTELEHYFTHVEPRFYIHTPITLHINGQRFSLKSTDVSVQGLSFNPPENLELVKGALVSVSFDRWQSQTKKVSLNNIPYIVKNDYKVFDQAQIGMERLALRCSKETNHFFADTIEKNKEVLAQNNNDIITPQESQIFTTVLSQALSSIPFYFGMSDEGKRIVQAVAETKANQASENLGIWQALTKMAVALSERLKNHSSTESINFGLYCYRSDENMEWTMSTDLELKSSAQKAVFINLALAHKQHHFYQCSLTPVSNDGLNQERDLIKQLSELRQHSPHKVKKIREILQNIFAIGVLRDITNIIKAAY